MLKRFISIEQKYLKPVAKLAGAEEYTDCFSAEG